MGDSEEFRWGTRGLLVKFWELSRHFQEICKTCKVFLSCSLRMQAPHPFRMRAVVKSKILPKKPRSSYKARARCSFGMKQACWTSWKVNVDSKHFKAFQGASTFQGWFKSSFRRIAETVQEVSSCHRGFWGFKGSFKWSSIEISSHSFEAPPKTPGMPLKRSWNF